MARAGDNASTPLQTLVVLVASVFILSAVGSIALGTSLPSPLTQEPGEVSNTPIPSAETHVQTATPTIQSEDTLQSVNDSKDVEIVFERAGNKVAVAANGGEDLGSVTSFTIKNASVNGTMDPDSGYPQVTGTIDPPTTVKVIATFEDGTTAVVAEKEFS